MEKNNILDKIKKFDGNLGIWQIVIGDLSLGDYILGYYYDEDEKLWKVYINNERGRHRVRIKTTSEQEAIDKLYSMVKFQFETLN